MKPRLIVTVMLLGLGAIVIGWIFESPLDSGEESGVTEIPDNVDFYMTQFTLRAIDDDGALDFQLQSPRLEHRPGGDVSQINRPRLRVFRDGGQWTLEARRGQFAHRSNTLQLQRRVVMRKLEGNPFELLTDALRFEPDLDLVTALAGVTMENHNSRTEADSAVLNLDDEVYRLTGARTVYYHDKPG